jgi:hypothetical protein
VDQEIAFCMAFLPGSDHRIHPIVAPQLRIITTAIDLQLLIRPDVAFYEPF